MKKILIGLLFAWIIIFSVIGYLQQSDRQTNEEDTPQEYAQAAIVMPGMQYVE